MSKMFLRSNGNWTEFRNLPDVHEVDFHWANECPHDYWDSMSKVKCVALESIRNAHEDGNVKYVLFTHGYSTSRRGKTTARSQVRGLMRSKGATPYIDRKRCIQHYSVFVAVLLTV